MKSRKAVRWLPALLAGVEILVLLFFAGHKKGYFIDEIYSFGLSNGYYKPFVSSYDVFDRWVAGSEFTDYIVVNKGEQFAYGSVYYNQTQDVHPPLYYMLLHTVCSFTPGTWSKWQGIAVNVFFYGGCLALIYLTAQSLTESRGAAAVSMMMWGLSPGGLSTGIYIRMYMMMTFFTMAGVYLHVKMVREGQTAGRLLLICASTFLGLLTQYYFVFMAFFLSAAYALWKAWRRKWREAAIYCGALLGSVGLMVLAFPACIAQLTRADEFVAEETRNNLLNGGAMARNLISYLSNLNMDFFAGRIRETAAAAVLALAFIFLNKIRGRKKKEKSCLDGIRCGDKAALALMLVWGLSFLAVCLAAVVTGARYIYNLYPLFSVLAVWGVMRVTKWGLGKTRAAAAVQTAAAMFMGILFLNGFRLGYVAYLYPEQEERARIAKEYADLFCLYIDDYENAPLTQDLIELSDFREVYITPEENIECVQGILEGKDTADGLVVYVDVDDFWSSGYEGIKVMERLKEETGASGYCRLYSNGLSETYLLR